MLSSNQYDDLAENYEQNSGNSAYNEYCERPNTLSLLDKLDGKTVLDAACGTGYYASYCEKHNAKNVIAFDGSQKMTQIASKNLSRTTVHHHDLAKPFTIIPNGSVDIIICALALEYVENLFECLINLKQLLIDGGLLIFSIENPLLVFQRFGVNYWDQELITHNSTYLDGVKGYRRSLSQYLNTIEEAGFLFERLLEAKPVKKCKEKYPDIYKRMNEIPHFYTIKIRNERSCRTSK